MVITDSQQVLLTVNPVDKRGNPAMLGAVPAWNVSDPTLATLNTAADGLSSTVLAIGPLGHVQVSATVTNPDGSVLSGTLEIDIVSGAAATLNIAAGQPTEQ